MRKGLYISLLFLVLSSVGMGLYAQEQRREHVNDIETMIGRSRWGEARAHLERLTTELDPVTDYDDMVWAEYHKVRCAVELGAADAEAMMLTFLERYPASRYTTSVRFMHASYVCDSGDYDRALELFDQIEYSRLDARERERYDIRMGYLLFLEGDYYGAKSYFDRVPQLSEYYHHALYYRAYIDYIHGKNGDAERGFKELAEYDTYRDLAPYYLLQIEYRRGNYNYVITEGERLLPGASMATRADLVRILAESYFIGGDYANALRYISNYPQESFSRQEYYIKGYSLYRMAQYRDAAQSLVSVCGADDALSQNASYHLGDCYLRLGDKPKAANAFAIASAQGFDAAISEDAHLNYGRLMFELGGGIFNESINILKSYLERYPYSPHVLEVRGLLVAAFYNSEDYEAAYVAIRELENPDREMRAAHQKVAVFLAVDAIQREDWAMAEQLLEEAESISLVPKYNALVKYWQGEVAYNAGDMDRASECYEEYLRRAPKSEIEYHYANYGLGYTYLNMGEYDNAKRALNDFVRDYTTRDGYLFDAHNRLGDAYYASREFAEARRAYRVSAGGATEDRHYANYQLAMVDGIENKNTSKIDRLKGIVTTGDGSYVDDAWYELGRTYISLQRYSDGARTLQDFVDNDATSPFYISALQDLALAYYNLNRPSDALGCYESIVDYNPQSAEALTAIRSMREIYVAEGNVEGYFDYAQRHGLESDMTVASRDSLSFASAKSIYLNGDVESAAPKLREYLENFESGYNRSEALFYLSDCYVLMEDHNSALSSMEQLLDMGQSQYRERVLGVYARMSFDEAQYEDSADAYLELYNTAHDQKERQVASEGYVDAVLHYESGAELKRIADEVLAMSDATDWAKRQMTLAKADVLREEGSVDVAMELYNSLAGNRMTVEGAEAYYRLIEHDYNRGDYSAAESKVYALGECGSLYWQARIFLLLGDVLVKSGNTFQARATYQSIVDGYNVQNDGIVAAARERIASLAN